MFALVDQCSVTLAETDLCLPADILDGLAEFFEAYLQLAADLGRIAIGPGAFDEGLAGMAVTGFGDPALTTLTGAGIFARCQAEVAHELSWVIEACQVTEFGDDGDGGEELYASQCLDGLDDRIEAPIPGLVPEFGLKALQPCLLFRVSAKDSAPLQPEWLRCLLHVPGQQSFNLFQRVSRRYVLQYMM